MDISFIPLEKMLELRETRCEDFPYQDILLTRLCMHMQEKLLDKRNNMLMSYGLNETLFMALITLESAANRTLQPSVLSDALGVSRTSVTRIVDELEKRGLAERHPDKSDRRCFHLCLTDKGHTFLKALLPPQYRELKRFWATLTSEEKDQYEKLTRKLLVQLDSEAQ